MPGAGSGSRGRPRRRARSARRATPTAGPTRRGPASRRLTPRPPSRRQAPAGTAAALPRGPRNSAASKPALPPTRPGARGPPLRRGARPGTRPEFHHIRNRLHDELSSTPATAAATPTSRARPNTSNSYPAPWMTSHPHKTQADWPRPTTQPPIPPLPRADDSGTLTTRHTRSPRVPRPLVVAVRSTPAALASTQIRPGCP